MRTALGASTLISVVGVVVGSLAACTSGSSTSTGPGGGNAVSTSVNTSQQAGSLSPSDTQQYCQDLAAFFDQHYDQIRSFSCSITAGFGAIGKAGSAAQQACRDAYAWCESPDGGASATPANIDCTMLATELKGCTATVAEINQCEQDAIAEYSTVTVDSVCSNLGGDASATTSTVTNPASCATVQQKCPGFNSSSSSSSASNDADGGN